VHHTGELSGGGGNEVTPWAVTCAPGRVLIGSFDSSAPVALHYRDGGFEMDPRWLRALVPGTRLYPGPDVALLKEALWPISYSPDGGPVPDLLDDNVTLHEARLRVELLGAERALKEGRFDEALSLVASAPHGSRFPSLDGWSAGIQRRASALRKSPPVR